MAASLKLQKQRTKWYKEKKENRIKVEKNFFFSS